MPVEEVVEIAMDKILKYSPGPWPSQEGLHCA